MFSIVLSLGWLRMVEVGKGPLEVSLSNTPAQAGSHTAGCPDDTALQGV